MKQCALHAVAASLVRESGALHGARKSVPVLHPPAVSQCGQRYSDQTAGVDGYFCETDLLHEVLETTAASSLVAECTAASSFAAETDQLHAESESSGARVWHPVGYSAWRSRVGGLRLRRQAHSRSGNFVVDSSSSSHHVDSVHTRSVGCAHGEHVLHSARTNSCLVTHAARVNSFGLRSARGNSGGHINSYSYTYNSCGGVRGGTKPMRRGQDVMGNPSLPISQVVKIMPGSADMVTRLPLLSSLPCHLGRAENFGMGWVGHRWRK